MPTPSRPLSPHLQVYRWQISNSLSILNRLTGVILSVAFLMFCGWLVLAAAGLKGYQPFADLLRGPLGAVALAGACAALEERDAEFPAAGEAGLARLTRAYDEARGALAQALEESLHA